MNNEIHDFTAASVGDRVWSLQYGESVITKVTNRFVKVEHSSSSIVMYSKMGYRNVNDRVPEIYNQPIRIYPKGILLHTLKLGCGLALRYLPKKRVQKNKDADTLTEPIIDRASNNPTIDDDGYGNFTTNFHSDEYYLKNYPFTRAKTDKKLNE